MISTIASITAVAIGGAIGAVLRYGVNIASVSVFGHGFPWATLIVNVVGSFVMGAIIAYFAHFGEPSHVMRAFIITGLLGAFTTFSTFSLDTVALWERGLALQSAGYILVSVFLSVSALLAAMFIVKGITS